VSGKTKFEGTACAPLADSLTGMIPLIVRGTCTFVTKIRNAQNAGATAVVVYNNVAGDAITMGNDGTGSDITIPSVMVSRANGLAVRAGIVSATTTFSLDPAGLDSETRG
jgi:hypothetical protein